MKPLLKFKPEVKELWLEALLSGRYLQAKGTLRREATGQDGQRTHAYCCLGVLTDLYIQQAPEGTPGWSNEGGYSSFLEECRTPPVCVMEWACENFSSFEEPAVDCEQAVCIDREAKLWITNLNDGTNGQARHTFAELAAIIREKL